MQKYKYQTKMWCRGNRQNINVIKFHQTHNFVYWTYFYSYSPIKKMNLILERIFNFSDPAPGFPIPIKKHSGLRKYIILTNMFLINFSYKIKLLSSSELWIMETKYDPNSVWARSEPADVTYKLTKWKNNLLLKIQSLDPLKLVCPCKPF